MNDTTFDLLAEYISKAVFEGDTSPSQGYSGGTWYVHADGLIIGHRGTQTGLNSYHKPFLAAPAAWASHPWCPQYDRAGLVKTLKALMPSMISDALLNEDAVEVDVDRARYLGLTFRSIWYDGDEIEEVMGLSLV